MGGVTVTSYTVPKSILFAMEPKVAVSVILANTGLVADANGKKILKAGTPLSGNLLNRALAFIKAVDVAATNGTFTNGSQVLGDGAVEIDSLIVTHGADANGNVTIKLGERAGVAIAVAQNDTAVQVAAKIAAGAFPGWTAALDAEDDTKVLFTCADAGPMAAPLVDYAATGVTGTVAEVTKGGGMTITLPVAASSNAVGILLHDVDVTAGNENGTMLIFGFVDISKMETAEQNLITAPVKAALAGKIQFVS